MNPVHGPSRWSAFAPLAALLFGALAAAARAGDPPPCEATASLDPERATVGQQVVYRVRILFREDVAAVDWTEPPSFPGFRAEWLPGRLSPEPIPRGGARYREREERRALFPEHPGELRVKPADLRCRTAGDAGEQSFALPVPAAALRVAAPPAEARPPDFADLIGPIAVQTIVTPREVRLGGSVRVAVMLRGSGNLWNAPDPLPDIEGAEVFPHRPELSFETGATLSVKRHFSYDVVPLREGALAIPALRVPYFDPETRRFATAATEAVRVAVGPRAAAAGAGSAEESPASGTAANGAPADRSATADAAGESALRERWPWPTAAAVLAAAGALLAARRRARARRAAAALDRALAAGQGDEAAALARALRRALARRVPGAPSLTAEEIAALPALPAAVAEAARLLAEAERARFDASASAPARDTVARAIAKL